MIDEAKERRKFEAWVMAVLDDEAVLRRQLPGLMYSDRSINLAWHAWKMRAIKATLRAGEGLAQLD